METFLANFKASEGMPSWLIAAWPVFVLILVWSIFWKGLGLWHSSRRGDSTWFIIMLVVNAIGILEIIYLFFILKIKINELFKK